MEFLLSLPVAMAAGVALFRGGSLLRAARGHRTSSKVFVPQGPRGMPSRGEVGAVMAALLVLHLPLVFGADLLLRADATLLSDAPSHAHVMQLLGKGQATGGWIDAYNGGFPVGFVYQPLAWLAGGLLVALGMAAPVAFYTLAYGSVVGLPLAMAGILLAAGLAPASVFLGATVVAAMAPYNGFLGGWPSVFGSGMITQSVGLFFVALAVGLPWTATRWRRSLPGLMAVLSVAGHAQVGTLGLGLGAVGAFAAGATPARQYGRRVLLPGVVGAVALYLPGALRLDVPFGIGPLHGWKQIGYPLQRAELLVVQGQLFDHDRAPILTTLVLVGLVLSFFRWNERPLRGALVAWFSCFGLLFGADVWPLLGRWGTLILKGLQPLRAGALLPVVSGVLVALALDPIERFARAWGTSTRRETSLDEGMPSPSPRPPPPSLLGRGFRVLPLVVAASVGLALLPSLRAQGEALVGFRRHLSPSAPCGPGTPEGIERKVLASWVQSAREGRLAFDTGPSFGQCLENLGLGLESSVALGASGGAGGTASTTWAAFLALHPDRPGVTERAESLGIRYLIHGEADRPGPPEKWKVVHRHKSMEMSERIGGSGLIGVGCVQQWWKGSHGVLEDALLADYRGPATTLADPSRWVALESTRSTPPGPLLRLPFGDASCDPKGARVDPLSGDSHHPAASIVAPAPVWAVVRVTAFPEWRITVDGSPRPWIRVAPGFMAIPLEAGSHRIEAHIDTLPTYRPWLLGGSLALALASLLPL